MLLQFSTTACSLLNDCGPRTLTLQQPILCVLTLPLCVITSKVQYQPQIVQHNELYCRSCLAEGPCVHIKSCFSFDSIVFTCCTAFICINWINSNNHKLRIIPLQEQCSNSNLGFEYKMYTIVNWVVGGGPTGAQQQIFEVKFAATSWTWKK